MKRSHRRLHAMAWALLLPALLVLIYVADVHRVKSPPGTASPEQPSGAGVLP